MRLVIFDPDIVTPRDGNISMPIYWKELVDWVQATPGALLGQGSYDNFVENYASWLADSALSSKLLAPLLNRICAAVLLSNAELRSESESVHLIEAYKIKDRSALLLKDLKNSPASNVDIASKEGNWDTCNNGMICEQCTLGDVGLIFSPGSTPIRVLGKSPQMVLPQFPIDQCTSCVKDSFGNHYAEDSISGLWWTRDYENHGGVVFKTYKKIGKVLKFDADRDSDGVKILQKHKGPKRIQIQLSKLARCGNPSRHCG